MRTSVRNLLLAVASLCAAGPGLQAQSFNYVADVPFNFHAANQDLKPGKYSVRRSVGSNVEWMREVDGRTHIAVASGPLSMEKPGAARLVFRHRGGQYYLAEIWNWEGKGTVVPQSKEEKSIHETMAANRSQDVTVYLASLK